MPTQQSAPTPRKTSTQVITEDIAKGSLNELGGPIATLPVLQTASPITTAGVTMTSIGHRSSRFNTAHCVDITSFAPKGVVRSSSSSPVRRDSTKNRLAAQAHSDPITAVAASAKDHETKATERIPQKLAKNLNSP